MSSENKDTEHKESLHRNPYDSCNVWPVTVDVFLAWHNVSDAKMQAFLAHNSIQGLSLRRILFGFHQELIEYEEDGKPKSEMWNRIESFLQSEGVRVLSPFAQ
jgi:hypothetical protein